MGQHDNHKKIIDLDERERSYVMFDNLESTDMIKKCQFIRSEKGIQLEGSVVSS